ncbi:conserved hypothetical protein [Methanocella paludicola SANAE]|uniref:Glycosyltransferase RgtA/B/C/D-like domain-containing protein n=1 Tax=Methanocella paludicola (strain DSM 17711 / JCM 13418 / NBRC 101707 / SANAE) TaxID=304371 RepID=D1YWJ8_METPS|nr:hypothetical protein [Methanocella paludicola]BAI60820.1 conserved hypothetical protein [Methanocella paludicola SANAE]
MYLFGLAGLLFLALTAVFGYSLLSALKLPLKGLEAVVASPIVGIIPAAWLCLIPYMLTGSLDNGIAVASVIMLAVLVLARPGLPHVEREHLAIVAALATLAFAFTFLCLLTYYNGEYHVGYPFYGDASFHSSVITSFGEGYNYPPSYPVMAGQTLRYTFLIDFFSAALYRLGLGLQWSVVLPGWLLLTGLLSLIYFLGDRFFSRRAGGILTVTLVMLSGGLGFFLGIRDLLDNGLYGFLLGNLNYTTVWSYNLVFTNFIIIVLAQRTALAGFAIGAFVMLVLYAVLVQGNESKNGLLLAGMLTGLLPMFHVYSYIAILLSSGLLLLIFRERKWYYFMAPALFLAIPQALWIAGQMGVSHFNVQIGWMAASPADIPLFWLANMGLELLLLIGGIFLVERKNLKFYLPFLAIFMMANIFVFQPWDYDNHKFFSFWLMPSALLMAASLLYVYELPKLGKPLFAVLLTLTVLTGALASAFILFHPYVEYSQANVYVSDWIKENTPKDAVFLTSQSPISPVTSLSGRKSYLGYAGWLYTHGINYNDRLYEVKSMYSATDAGKALSQLSENGIDYVLIGPDERGSGQFYVNEEFYDSRLELVFNWTDPTYHNTYRIYKV